MVILDFVEVVKARKIERKSNFEKSNFDKKRIESNMRLGDGWERQDPQHSLT